MLCPRPVALMVPLWYTTLAPSCSNTPRSGTKTRPARSVGGGLRFAALPFTVTLTGPAANAGIAAAAPRSDAAASADRRRVVDDVIEYEDLRASMLPEVLLPVLSDFSDWRRRINHADEFFAGPGRDLGERSVAHRAGDDARLRVRAELVILVLVVQRALVRAHLEPGHDPAVHDGHQEQREDQRAEQTADQHGAHRAPELGALRQPERQRQHAEHHGGRGHHDRAQARAGR